MDAHSALSGTMWFAPVALAFLTAVAGTILLALASGGNLSPRLPGGDITERWPALMGGIAIFVAFLASAGSVGMLQDARYLLAMMCLMFAVGLWSNVAHTREGVELAVQVIGTTLLAGHGRNDKRR